MSGYFTQHRAMGRDFCMRLLWNFYSETRDLYRYPESGKIEECQITLASNRESSKKCQELEVSNIPITLRLIRARVCHSMSR
jgi:hypothetical protein